MNNLENETPIETKGEAFKRNAVKCLIWVSILFIASIINRFFSLVFSSNSIYISNSDVLWHSLGTGIRVAIIYILAFAISHKCCKAWDKHCYNKLQNREKELLEDVDKPETEISQEHSDITQKSKYKKEKKTVRADYKKKKKELKRTYLNSTNNKFLKVTIVILSCILFISLIANITQQVHFNTQIDILNDKLNKQKEYTQHYKDMYIDLKNAIKKTMNGEELSFSERTALQNIEYKSNNYN